MPSPPTSSGAQASSAKSLKKARSGHLARLTKLVHDIEDAMAHSQDVKAVLKLQDDASMALENFQSSSQKYTASLTNESEITREIEVLKQQRRASEALNHEIISWVTAIEQRSASVPPQSQRPASRADSQQSHASAISEAEKSRRRCLLEYNHEKRRQDETRAEEAAQREERAREFERKQTLRMLEESYERACLEADFVSDDDTLNTASGNSRAVTSMENSGKPPRQLRDYSHANLPTTAPTSNLNFLPSNQNPRLNTPPIDSNLSAPLSLASEAAPANSTSSISTQVTDILHAPRVTPALTPSVKHQSFDLMYRETSFQARRDNLGYPNPASNNNMEYRRLVPQTAPVYHHRSRFNEPFFHHRVYNPEYGQQHGGYMPTMPQNQLMSIYSAGVPPHPYGYPPPYMPSYRHDRIVDSLGNMADAFRLGTDLPKPDLRMFSGDPREFYNFKNAFISIIESKTLDDRLRLHFLIQYCTGPAKQAIEYCQMFHNPSHGLQEAKAVLANTYGQTYDIVQAYKNPILNGPNIKPNDSNGLLNLSLEMRKCNLALSQLGFGSDINNSETLLRIVWKLPYHLQGKWVAKASEIFDMGRDPTFADLTEFIRNSAKMANNFYGRNIRRESGPSRPPSQQQRTGMRGTTLLATNSGNVSDKLPRHLACLFCKNEGHDLGSCAQFKAFAMKDRYQFASVTKLCHNCLLVGHVVRGCLVRSRCTQSDCRRKHHYLFHNDNSQTAEINAISASAEEPKPPYRNP